ncbi:amino acid adenylation domain-containing protein [Dactylosporangium sp. NBC_01737]|uniref:non-ribosomal peptide synthetase n=1 Tax=Dactylosporangium sp. NBC_01737 TaxID=2975959 RepID=UPI002E0D971D|nr:non-ribosomal peptide synthetase [Dactylosporangium sp. NBC_01737]WSG39760.1 amino acid adenylation domain-containing protein [Dactylosporangium sp. NBC_01737]
MSALRAAQERLWFLHQLDPADASYHLPLVMHVRGRLDRAALERALDAVTGRHESLRTRVELLDGAPVLAAAPDGVRLETAVATGLEAARDLVATFVTRPFDLTAGPVLRCLLIDAGPDGHVLALVAHHIAADGWSLQVLRRDLDALYRAYATGAPAVLPKLPDLPPATTEDAPDLGYWTGRLAGAAVLELPTDHPRPPVRRGHGSSVVFDIPVDLLRRLEAVARAERTTVYTALVAAFSLLLGRMSGQDDVCLGTPVLGRDDPDLADHVGCFAETLVLRTDLSGDPTFRALLRVARRTVLGALSHATPFERVVSAIGAPRDRSRTPLFQAMIMYLRQEQDRPRLGDLDVALLDHPFDSARTDVSLDVIQGPTAAVGVLTVDRDLFDPGTAQRLIRRLLVLLDDAARRPGTAIGDLRWFDDDERREALTRWNGTGAGHVTPLITQLFQAQARSAPDAVAVTGGGVELTYSDLDAEVDRLAARLRGRGPLIGVGLSRSPAMVVALLAVWRAGAAYLPLDPAYPADRLAFVIADAGVGTVLTESAFAARFGAASLLIDAPAEVAPATAPETATAPDDPAYVLYTSGSTGRPKGVVVPHGALAAFVAAMADVTGPQAGRVWLALTSLSFDISGLELYLPLSRGGRVVVADDGQTGDGAALRALIAGHGVTDVQATPSGWRMLLAAGFDHDVPAALVGGEALPATLAAELRGKVGRLTNVYGPTETTIWSTSWPVPERPATISIGGPISGTRVYVVDGRMRPVPAGVPGELVIAGAGVALGYLRRPRLTAERFVPDPWPDPQGPAGARMYRTGDRVRRRGDGTLEFLGRLDTQVKVRGHRIELGEVETVLAGCPGVAAAVAAVRDDALGAYVTARPGAVADPAAIRDAARRTLPAYAVPSTVTVLDALPLTPNGKVDRAALPDPRPSAAAAYVPPRTEAETRVAAVFAEVFGAAEVGAHDDFFALGGHSLLAAKVAARLPGLTVRDLFDHPAVEALARRIPLAGDTGGDAWLDGAAPLTDAQRRLWFLQRLDPHDASYNMFLVLRLRGRVDGGALRRALDALAARHLALRCAYPEIEGDPSVEVGPATVPFEELAVESEAAARAAVARRTNAPFDLRSGAPVRASLLRLGPDDHVFCLVMHHIAGDGWSLNVLRGDLATLYAGHPLAALPPVPAANGDPEADLAHWRERLADPAVLDLPTDRPRPAEPTHRGGFLGAHLPPDVTTRLEDLAGRARTSLFAVLLAAYQVLLARHTGQSDVLVGSTLAARDRVELERAVGYFARTVVLRNRIDRAEPFTDLLGRARECVLDALTHTEVPFERLVPDAGPLFQTMCILHTQDEGTPVEAFADLHASFFDSGYGHAKFDLMLEAWRAADGLSLVFGYDTDLLDAATVERWARRFEVLCAGIAADPATAVGALPLLTAGDEALVRSLSAPATDGPAPPPVHGLPRLAAPDTVAVRCGTGALTYADLNRRADALAATLRASIAAGPGVIAVAAHRDIDTIVALLAIWRAGGAYLPIDPAQPAERIARLVAGSGAVLTVGDAPWPPLTPAEATLGGAAYVLYTSGSTGTPKAVVVDHEALAARVDWMRRDYRLGPGDTVVQFAPLAFDTHAEEIWPALSAGATVRLLPDGPLSLPDVLAGPGGADVTVLDLPTAYWHDLVAQIDAIAWPPRLRLVILGGEAVHAAAVSRWHARFGGTVRLVNTYGPTEATIIATSTDLGPLDTDGPPAIGVPLPGVRIAVVGADLRPVPPGAYGELLLGGAGLARGYLGRDDLTRDRFVTWRGTRYYRTGDRVRLRADGRLDFAGRLDDQLKVRGFRIEPAEVEHHLLACPGVTGAVVTAHNGALVAYVAGVAPADTLRARLAAQLPAHMVPDRWIPVDALPRTPTGKVDRRALPPPVDGTSAVTLPPRTDAEQLIADVWADVLGLDGAGVDDDFFALGGHSLLAVRVAARLRAMTDLDLPIRLLFTHRRLADLAAAVEQRLLDDLAGLTDAEVAGLLEAETR